MVAEALFSMQVLKIQGKEMGKIQQNNKESVPVLSITLSNDRMLKLHLLTKWKDLLNYFHDNDHRTVHKARWPTTDPQEIKKKITIPCWPAFDPKWDYDER